VTPTAQRWVVVPYRDGWPADFEREAAVLRQVFSGPTAHIKHIGSTAVPGLGAKPIIDIMVGVGDLAEVAPHIPLLARHGYAYQPDFEAQLPDRRFFHKPAARPRTHHLHVVEHDSPFWHDHLAFRDHLRRHPEVAQAYYELKVQLAAECSETGGDYPERKAPFIQGVIARLATD